MAAKMLGLNDTGIIAVGKRADLVALAGNPFENMSATKNVRLVMKDGNACRNDRKREQWMGASSFSNWPHIGTFVLGDFDNLRKADD